MAKVIIGLYVIAASLALILMKLGSSTGSLIAIEKSKLALNINPTLIIAGFLYILSFGFYTFLISRYDLGYIIPLGTALVYIVIFVASFLIFHETFTLLKVLAICLIIAGVILLNFKN